MRLAEREFFPIVMHLSGPLLEWLESSHSKYLDMVGELAAAGKIEMLLSGYYEPVLAALPRDDRVEQILWMREAIESRFGVTATDSGSPSVSGSRSSPPISPMRAFDTYSSMTGIFWSPDFSASSCTFRGELRATENASTFSRSTSVFAI